MTAEIKVPRLAESISEAVLAQWLKQDGESVRADEPIATLETDKAAVEIPADREGILRHARQAGEKVEVGDVIARIEEAAGDGRAAAAPGAQPAPGERARPSAAPAPSPARAPQPPAGESAAAPAREPAAEEASPAAGPAREEPLSPAVRRMVEEFRLDPSQIPASGKGGRLLKEDVQRFLEAAGTQPTPAAEAKPPSAAEPGERPAPAPAAPRPAAAPPPVSAPAPAAPSAARAAPITAAVEGTSPLAVPWAEGEIERAVPMSRIRRRIAERLVQSQQTAAILTTFNEVDMGAVMDLRGRFKEGFERRHGVKLSYMSFFTRACVLTLQEIPDVNAEIRGGDIVYHRRVHMGIAVQTGRGLVVPVVHDADLRDFAGLETEIARLALAARENRLSLAELSGGTFTISNGGVFGSLLSTPILNPPQSGILGMHKIERRPVVVGEEIVIRPMMYLALSYDHRIVDGEQAVTFLVGVKQKLEDPERMLLGI